MHITKIEIDSQIKLVVTSGKREVRSKIEIGQ